MVFFSCFDRFSENNSREGTSSSKTSSNEIGSGAPPFFVSNPDQMPLFSAPPQTTTPASAFQSIQPSNQKEPGIAC